MKPFSLAGIHIAFNAPPSAGKDTLVAMLVDATHASAFEFKAQVINLCLALTGLGQGQWEEWYREDKELVRPQLLGHSCRSLQILIAETFIKPNFGQGYFAESVCRESMRAVNGAAYSDLGFNEELAVVANKAPGNSVIVVRVFRDGYSYEATEKRAKDSRYYINPDDYPDVVFIDVHNEEGKPRESFQLMFDEIRTAVKGLRLGTDPLELCQVNP